MKKETAWKLLALALSPGTRELFARCAMCQQTAAALPSRQAMALNQGIVLLLCPPLLILAGFLMRAYRRRHDGNS